MGDWQPDLPHTPPEEKVAQARNESSDADSQSLTWMKTKIHGLVSQFLDGIGYNGPTTGDDFDGLLQGVHEQARALGIPQPEGSKSRYFFIVGLHYARVCSSCLILPGAGRVPIPSVSHMIRELITSCGASHNPVLLPEAPDGLAHLHRHLHLARGAH